MLSTVIGSQRYTTRSGRTSRGPRPAPIGFLDGVSNLDPRHSDEDQKLVFVDPSQVSYPANPAPANLRNSTTTAAKARRNRTSRQAALHQVPTSEARLD